MLKLAFKIAVICILVPLIIYGLYFAGLVCMAGVQWIADKFKKNKTNKV